MKYITEVTKATNGSLALTLPDWKDFSPEQQLKELEVLLAKGRALADRQGVESGHTFASLILPWEELSDAMGKVWGPVGHMNSVMLENFPTLKEVHDKGSQLFSTYATDIGQHEGLYSAYRSLKESTAYADLTPEQKKIIDDGIKDFELAGVALAKEKKDRLKVINERLTELTNTFGNNVQEAQKGWKKHIADEALLNGVPESAKGMMRQLAQQEGLSEYLVTTHQPIYIAIMQYATNRDLRREVYEAYMTRASDQGPNAGTWDNAPVMAEILALRSEKATILGFPNYNAFSLARKMAPSVERVSEFLEDLVARSKPKAEKEFAELSAFAKKEFSIDPLEGWDVPFVSEAHRKSLYDIDAEALRAYFPEGKAFEGMFELLKRIFGITFTERTDIPVWRESVRFFEMYDADGTLRGAVYADLYARSGKKPGAWMDTCVERITIKDGIQLPVAYFNCNFTEPTDGAVSTLRHDEIETMFHEFGHVIHHILGKTNYSSSAMIAVEWDAIEYPSQIMENWCWEEAMLTLISAHVETGESLPKAMSEKLNASKLFHAGIFLTRQLSLGVFDWNVHLLYDPAHPHQAHDVWVASRSRISVTPYFSRERYVNTFLHVFDGAYAAGYYSYLWAQVLESDVFQAFKENGIFDRTTGERYLHEILEVGGSRPMMESFRAFRGREPNVDALLKAYGLE